MLSPAIQRRRMSFAPGPAFYAFGATNPLFVRDYERQRYLDGAAVVSSGSALSVTRASTGTLINSSGILETLGNDAARFDWSTGRRALMNEATATNIVPYSDTNGAGWSDISATTSASGETFLGAFSGAVVASTGAVWNRRQIILSPDPSITSQAVTVIYRAGSSGRMRIVVRSGVTTFESVVSGVVGALSVSSSAAGAISGISETVVTSAIRKCTFLFTPNSTGVHSVGIGPDTTSILDITTIAAQFEQGSAPTSLIVTTGSSATRAAETVTIPSLALSTYDIRVIRTTGTTDLKLVVHPGGAYTVPNGAPVYQVLVYPGGTLP